MRIYFRLPAGFPRSGNDEYAPAQDWLATKFEPRKFRNILPERGYLGRLEMPQCGTAIAC